MPWLPDSALPRQSSQANGALGWSFVPTARAKCTGDGGGVLPGSSLFMLHFPYNEDTALERPEDWADPTKCDIALSSKVLDLALLLEDVFTSRSHGAISVAHTDADLDRLGEACRNAARRIKPYL